MAIARTSARGGGRGRCLALVAVAGLACGLEPAPQPQPQTGGNSNPGGSGDPNPAALPPAGYKLVWADEFAGASLDTSKWTALSGPRRDALMSPASVSVANGLLTMTTYTDGSGAHHTGFVSTEGLFAARYGYFEARIRFQDAPGSWCAFWISAHSVDFGGDPAVNGDEIDVVEHRVTDQGGWTELADMVALNVNWNGYGSDKRTAQLVTHLADNSKVQGAWHTYGVLWTSTGYVYYVDGTEIWRPQAPISQIAQDIRLTCEVQDASWAGYVPAGGYGSLATSTTKVDVDWVRVYQPQ